MMWLKFGSFSRVSLIFDMKKGIDFFIYNIFNIQYFFVNFENNNILT